MNKRLLCLVALLALPGAGGAESGGFEGKVVVEWVDAPFASSLRLVEDFGYREPEGKLWVASRGQVLEGKGLPPLLRDYVGQPFDGAFRKAALVYDAAVQKMVEPWERAQHMFFEAAVSEGVAPADAKIMYLVLGAQGTRWEVAGSRCYGSCHGNLAPLEWRPVVDEKRLGELVQWVRAADPSLRDIDLRVQAAIRAVGPHIFTQSACNEFSGSTRIRKSCD